MLRILFAAVALAATLALVDHPDVAFDSEALLSPVAVVESAPAPTVPASTSTAPSTLATVVSTSPAPAPKLPAPELAAPAPAPLPTSATTTTPPTASVAGPVTDPDETAYRFAVVHKATGLPARFNPCEAVHYVVNPKGAPPDAVALTQAAVNKIVAATGITFAFDGTTTEPAALPNAGPDRRAYQPERYGSRWAPVLVAWTSFAPGGLQQLGGLSNSPIAEKDGKLVKFTGQVLLSTDMPLPQESVLLHELGHLMGLDHVANPRQIMRPGDLSGEARWGKGDSAGLRQLGREAGCLSVPPPH
ncbi:MAG TPA: hypothetical protein VM121_07910 [Acidimicrobiales bacterium]|nr:hypothetical protein [Acidimicrobiales bacterium]